MNNTQLRLGSRFVGLRLHLLLAFGFLGLLVVGVAITAGWGLWQIRQTTTQAVTINGSLRTLASQIAIQTLLCRRYEKDVLLDVADPSARDSAINNWETAYSSLAATIAQFDAIATLPEDHLQANQWQVQGTRYQAAFAQIRAAINAGTLKSAEAANQAFTPSKESIRDLTESALVMRDNKVRAAQTTERVLDQTLNITNERVTWMSVLALILATGFAFVFSVRLLRPVFVLHNAINQLSVGALNARVTVQRHDELGAMAQGFNGMADQLQAQLEQLQQTNAETHRLRQLEIERRQWLEQIVAEYLAFVEQVAQGDLTRRLAEHQHDTLGPLGQGLNGMVERLHTMTCQVQQASTNLSAAAAEILAATTQQGASAAEQSAAITQTSTTLAEVKAIALQTAQQAAQVAQDSQALLDAAAQGTAAVDETITGMRQIRQRVESIAQTILLLAEQTQSIGVIITSVAELADHSNLLALNAAIEAARAGEQGKSFAVVAHQVRDLAERSKTATTNVRTILGDIQRATNQAVLVTEEGTKGVEVGAHLSTQAGQVIQRIAGEIEGSTQANIQMAAAAHQQTAGMDQIAQAMMSIQQATAQTLASTRQAERAAHDLHALAQSLQQAIAAYRL